MRPKVKLPFDNRSPERIIDACIKQGKKSGLTPEQHELFYNEAHSAVWQALMAVVDKHFEVIR